VFLPHFPFLGRNLGVPIEPPSRKHQINDKVRLYGNIGQALLKAKESGGDTFAAIETVISWDDFTASVTEAQKLAQPT